MSETNRPLTGTENRILPRGGSSTAGQDQSRKRYELARDILLAMIANPNAALSLEQYVMGAIGAADLFLETLKEGEK